ncbi:MAG TPA: ABC transporter substrate-binding protein [Dehalococcoidia bacterium]|nr:ABC transporter substrate-binding protein [Dehalococcoidia bacterium]
MKKNIVWMFICCLLILSLVTSCESSTTERITDDDTEDAIKITESTSKIETGEGVVEKKEALLSPDVPKYGGVITSVAAGDPMGFDPGITMSVMCGTVYFTHDKLARGDWSKGPAGTGETDWLDYLTCNWNLLAPSLAESWETPDGETIICHIRHDSHYWNKAPMNGREITADDVVFSINRQWSAPTGFHTVSWGAVSRPISVTALDKYTVEIKVPPNLQGMHLSQTVGFLYIEAPEVIDQYGNYNDWQVMVASGPWIFSDYVKSSVMTFERNPNYWAYDPVHPENQLPYADRLKRLIIPDASTRLAAFRTGNIDYVQSLSWDDYSLLNEQLPELETKTLFGMSSFLVARVDKPELPFADLRVRQAMNLAINQQEILEEYYEGQGELLSWPWYSWKANAGAYIPLEDLPTEPTTADSRCGVQELFEYHPDKAKQLLTEAGYPNGFKTEIVCTAGQVDLLSICKEQLINVGIDMDLKVLESGVFNSTLRGRKHEQMIVTGGKFYFLPWFFYEVRIENFDNCAFYENPKTRAAYEECSQYVMKDADKTWQILRDITPFMLEQCVMGVYLPIPYAYDMWWPWLQNWYGATRIGYWEPETTSRYAWVDANMKRSMGY